MICNFRGYGATEAVVCRKASKLNHSCSPNVAHTYIQPHERVYAIKKINKGMITIRIMSINYWNLLKQNHCVLYNN